KNKNKSTTRAIGLTIGGPDISRHISLERPQRERCRVSRDKRARSGRRNDTPRRKSAHQDTREPKHTPTQNKQEKKKNLTTAAVAQ
ncbi:hypothetical protein IscW_ISCW015347, partial [Ixodes scapularis]